MRENVAKLLEKEVTAALIRQREEAFPDLEQSRVQLEQLKRRCQQDEEATKKDYRAKYAELDDWRKRLTDCQAELQAKEAKLNTLLAAFDAYLSWLDGAGEVDENTKRFNALREAYRAYKKG